MSRRQEGRRGTRALATTFIALSLITGVSLLGTAGMAGAAGTSQATFTPGSGDGLTVDGFSWIDPRLLDITVSTAALSAPAGVRVLVPSNYFTTTQRFPVLYLLHGGYGSYTDWTTYGDAESVTAGLPVIVVMPEGGENGWYANWDNFGAGGPPDWETFHIDQLIPWIDANFRTIADRDGRAIAGLSMGGFGAMSYAAQFPDMFVSASAFSGAVDTSNPAVEALIAVSPVLTGQLPGAIYGVPPFDEPGLEDGNPVDLAANLRGMHIALYTGNGLCGPLDDDCTIQNIGDNIQEAVVQQMSESLDSTLTSLGIPHTFDDYGDGTHSWPYWNRDLSEEMPAIMATFADPPAPADILADPGFESSGMGPWRCVGTCGVDQGLGNAHSGANNGWVRNTSAWNDIDQTVQVAPNNNYTLTGWIRSSSGNNAGYFGVRSTAGTVIGEDEYNSLPGYTQLTVNFNSGNNSDITMFDGLWGNGSNPWAQIDDVSLTVNGG